MKYKHKFLISYHFQDRKGRRTYGYGEAFFETNQTLLDIDPMKDFIKNSLKHIQEPNIVILNICEVYAGDKK